MFGLRKKWRMKWGFSPNCYWAEDDKATGDEKITRMLTAGVTIAPSYWKGKQRNLGLQKRRLYPGLPRIFNHLSTPPGRKRLTFNSETSEKKFNFNFNTSYNIYCIYSDITNTTYIIYLLWQNEQSDWRVLGPSYVELCSLYFLYRKFTT